MITVGRVVELVNFKFTNSATQSPVLRRNIVFELDQVLKELVSEFLHRSFLVEKTLSLVAGQSDYNVPNDFNVVQEPSMRLTVTPFTAIRWYDESVRVAKGWDRTMASTGTPRHFTVPGPGTSGTLRFRFWPTPDASYAAAYRYWAHPKSVVPSGNPDDVSDDQPIDSRFPEDCHEALVTGVQLRFPQYMMGEQLSTATGLYQLAKKRMRASSPVDGQVVQNRSMQLSDFSGQGLPWPVFVGPTAPPA